MNRQVNMSPQGSQQMRQQHPQQNGHHRLPFNTAVLLKTLSLLLILINL